MKLSGLSISMSNCTNCVIQNLTIDIGGKKKGKNKAQAKNTQATTSTDGVKAASPPSSNDEDTFSGGDIYRGKFRIVDIKRAVPSGGQRKRRKNWKRGRPKGNDLPLGLHLKAVVVEVILGRKQSSTTSSQSRMWLLRKLQGSDQ